MASFSIKLALDFISDKSKIMMHLSIKILWYQMALVSKTIIKNREWVSVNAHPLLTPVTSFYCLKYQTRWNQNKNRLQQTENLLFKFVTNRRGSLSLFHVFDFSAPSGFWRQLHLLSNDFYRQSKFVQLIGFDFTFALPIWFQPRDTQAKD